MTIEEETAALAICEAAAAFMNDLNANGLPNYKLLDALNAALIADNWIEGKDNATAPPTPTANDAAAPHTEGDQPR